MTRTQASIKPATGLHLSTEEDFRRAHEALLDAAIVYASSGEPRDEQRDALLIAASEYLDARSLYIAQHGPSRAPYPNKPPSK